VKIDGALAVKQHERYVEVLRSCLPKDATFIVVPAEEECPDSVFIEDTAVVLRGKGLVALPGAKSRRSEVSGTAAALKSLGISTVSLQAPGTLDGGDVLWTGREFFCGLSERTNIIGVEALRGAFPGVRVTPVPLKELTRVSHREAVARLAHSTARDNAYPEFVSTGKGTLHLKSILSMVGFDTLAVANTPLGRAVLDFILNNSGVPKDVRAAGGKLTYFLIPASESAAANALLVNESLIVRSSKEFPQSVELYREHAKEAGLKVIEVDVGEFAKADGALTCCSILV